jgi:DNA-directed RNA polymerase subunit E'/Rpb7
MKLVSPYKNIKQYTRISLEAYYMNSDIKNNIKMILKKKMEKKCNKNGYIDEIYRILEYSDGYMPPENLNGNAIYNIAYHCKICIPIENTIIIGQTRIINQELIVAINGPIMFFIPKENVDTNIWSITDNYLNKLNNKNLAIGDYVQIHVIDKRINQNDSQIKVIGKLLDYPTEDEINTYYGNQIINIV